jgi:hypothetical protein
VVVANVRVRLAVNEQGSHRFYMERFNLKTLNKGEGKEKFALSKVLNMFAVLKDLEIDSAWETSRENT